MSTGSTPCAADPEPDPSILFGGLCGKKLNCCGRLCGKNLNFCNFLQNFLSPAYVALKNVLAVRGWGYILMGILDLELEFHFVILNKI